MIVVVIAGLIVAVGIVIAAILVLSRRAGTMADPVHDIVHRPLPDAEPIDPDTLNRIEFDTALRGYRMAQVDEVVDRMVVALAERDAEISRLRGDEGVRLLADGDDASESGGAAAQSPPTGIDRLEPAEATAHIPELGPTATESEPPSGDAPTPGVTADGSTPASGGGN